LIQNEFSCQRAVYEIFHSRKLPTTVEAKNALAFFAKQFLRPYVKVMDATREQELYIKHRLNAKP
jgi:hypothetical protein